MKKTLLAAALLCSGAVNASVITFDSVGTQFWIDSHSEDGFTFARNNDGMATLAAGYDENYWRGNGTGRLLSWSNQGGTSGFTMSNDAGDLFSLTGFDFGNGYVSGSSAVASVTLTGTYAGGATITETITNAVNGWTTVALGNSWSGLLSVDFVANGSNNRAVWDNLLVNEVADVPAPASLAVLGLGLFALGLVRKKSKAA